MKKILMAVAAAAAVALPALSGPNHDSKITKGFNSMDAMGCMLLRECTDGVKEIYSLLDISSEYPNTDEFTFVANEFNNMLVSLNQVGVKVFLADDKYFPPGHRGVYHTVGNNFFLNVAHMHRPGTMMSVMRHEGWHAAQDCMAGTIENNFIAIIHDQEDVPRMYQAIAKSAYQSQPKAIPWEKEAYWAGHTEGMPQAALESCAAGTMWTDYEPTPMTGEWLRENGYIK